MANEIDKPIESLDTEWEGYLGSRIEAYLKQFLQNLDSKKHGDWLLTSDDNGLTTLRAFADTDSKEVYEKDPTANESLVLASVQFYSSGATSADYTLSTRITQNPDTDMVKGSSNVLKFTYNCYYGGDTTDLDPQNGYAKVTINNTEVSELSLSLAAGGNEYAIDLGKYLTQETNTVKLEVGNQHGKSRTWTFTIRALEIVLSFDSNYEESILRSGKWNLRVACRGVTALVHLMVDGDEIAQSTITNSTNDFTIDANGDLDAGVHTITMYAENTEYGIVTDVITTRFIKSGLTTPSICIGRGADTSVTLYGTASIAYFLYYPGEGGSTIAVNAELQSPSGNKLADLATQTVALNADGTSGVQELRAQIADNDYLSLGSVIVVLTVGTTSIRHTLTVQSAGITLEAASECKVYLSAAGRTNSDVDAEDWHSEYGGQTTCTVKRSDNFKLSGSNGFGADKFTIKAGKYITLDGFYPFGTDFGANSADSSAHTGRTVELEFMATNCCNSDTLLVDCMNNGVGFQIYANRIVLSSELGGKVETLCCDDTKIRVGICIDGTTTTCTNKLIGKDPQITYANIAYLYLNGVIVRMFDYGQSSWQQAVPQVIKIGSEDCDIELYTVRAYDKSLNATQMLGNYAYDTPSLDDKIAIATRNNVLNSSSEVDFNKVLTALPNTPYKIWEMDTMPTGKKDYVPCNTEFVNPAWDSSPNEDDMAMASFTCSQHTIALDGTSSMNYPDPYKNWANKYGAGTWSIKIGDKTVTITGYSITNGVALTAKEFVDKVNFASSEGIFNILIANAYHSILLSAAKVYPNLLTEKQAAQQAAGQDITYRQSLSGFPEIGYRRTYTNGISTINFLSIYNFINNKYDPTYFGMSNDGSDELWEVDDNINFFSEELTEGAFVDKTWTDRTTKLYYARVPKTSPTTGNDYGFAVQNTNDEVAQANKETYCIRRFHNWIYSCNPNIAERYKTRYGDYKALSPKVTISGTTYEKDTPAYRLAKFNAEHADYIVKESALFYFVFFDYFLGVDSMDKNMTIAFENVASGKPLARFIQRDSDTAALYGNTGTLDFKVFHEWNDSYDSSTGVTGEIVGENYSDGSFTPNTTAGDAVFNGRLSGLWDCVAGAWADDIKTMYQTMRSAGLNESNLWSLYNSFWSQWCEALYNTDAMGYANTGYFKMAHGDKREVMRYYFKYRSRYWDSKCGANTSSSLELRLWGSGNGVVLRHCYPLYASMNWGSQQILTQRNITPGTPAYFASTGSTFNQTTVTFYDADLVTKISTYTTSTDGTINESGLQGIAGKIEISNLGRCTRLEELELDFSGKAEPNTQLTNDGISPISNSIALRRLVVRNCPNVTCAITLTSEMVEEVDLRDTAVSMLTLPENEVLRSVQLGESITTLQFANFPKLTTLTLQGFDALKTIDITDCPSLDTQTLIENVLSSDNEVLASVRLTNINWTSFPTDYLLRLVELGATLKGRIAIDSTENISFALKQKLIAIFGDIDDENNDLYITYKTNKLTKISISGDTYIAEVTPADNPAKYQYAAVPGNSNGNDFRTFEWSITDNQYATIDKTTGVLTVTKIGTESRRPSATITLTVTKADGTQLTATFVVGFYLRSAHLGDYVYADGSYSDILDTGKTVVGVCFYIDPDNAANRLCVALNNLTSYPWGLQSFIPTLADTTMSDSRDVPSLVNKTSTGLKSGSQITDDNYLDEDGGDADGFYIFSSDSQALGEIGFCKMLAAWGDYPAGTIIPWGLINTLKIVAHRNTILSDSAVNLPIPAATENQTMLQNLYECMAQLVADNDNNTNYRQYYFPAASQCYSYEPTVKSGETLSDKFRQGMWFLPACGDLGRIYYYAKKGYDNSTENAIFATAYQAGKFSKITTDWNWSSTESISYGAWYINCGSGSVYYYFNKGNTYAVRAVAAF